MNEHYESISLSAVMIKMVRLCRSGFLRIFTRTLHLQFAFIRGAIKRKIIKNRDGLTVPALIAMSPTSKCNLECIGCYSRFHSRLDEISYREIDRFVQSAEDFGVSVFVITGGEPFMRSDMLDIYASHKNILFITVTNGTLIDEQLANRISRLKNVFPIISVEGYRYETDRRRGTGTYEKIMNSMALLKKYRVPFGFSSVITNETAEVLKSRAFINYMIERGCSVGFYNEFIPIDREDTARVPTEVQKEVFRREIQALRRSEPIVLVHMPEDEYDEKGRCTAVESGVVHINSRGYVEPCPFCHFAAENIKQNSFREILESPFLDALRRHPTALIRNGIGCSLSGNLDIVREIAAKTGAGETKSLETGAVEVPLP